MTLTVSPPIAFEFQLPLPGDAPDRAQQLKRKAVAALDKGRYDEALQAFATLGDLKDIEGALYVSKLGMAFTWRKQRDFSKALEVLKGGLGLGDDRVVFLFIGVTLHQMERYAEALDVFDKLEAQWPDDPDGLVYRMPSLVEVGRLQEALDCAERAFPLRGKSSDHGQTLYVCAALASVAFGLSALKRRSLPDYEKATDAFIKWRARARRDKQTAAFNQAVQEFKKVLPEEDTESFEEFMVGVRLMSIRDPFKAWKALGKEISKDWPEGLSAVDAIRQERD